jgi:RNA polymerase sigma-70 factor (ECF subfamily)
MPHRLVAPKPLDPAHADRVLKAYGARLRALVERQCLNAHGIDPDDVEQEVRIRLWHAIERDRSEALVTSYVQKVVVSVLVDALRKARARPSEPLPDEPGDAHEAFAAPHGPDREAGDAERMVLLGRCLGAIPERRRVPVELHLQGFSLQEIGAAVDVSAEAARKLVARGLEELKERLRALGLGDLDD